VTTIKQFLLVYFYAVMREKINKIANKIIRIIASKYFFWGIILLFLLQSIWIAFSAAYSMPYDERFHFGVINIFGHQWSPFILDQPTEYDIYGNLAHGDATLFHYLMSFPCRIVSLFTNNLAVQVISLRLLCIIMVAVGIGLFNKLFKKIGIKQAFINVGMLLFVLLPIVPFLAATINYDNMLFLLTPLFLIICVDVLSSKKIIWSQYAWFLIIGCFASLVKYAFLPVFAIGVIYLVVMSYKRHGKSIFSKLLISFKSVNRLKIIGIMSLVILAIGMFSLVYLQSLVMYGSPRPNCEKVMSKDRCEKNSVYITYFSDQAISTNSATRLVQTPDYISHWSLQMVDWAAMTGGGRDGISSSLRQPLPVVYMMIFTCSIVGLLSLFYSWRSIKKKPSWYFLITVSVALIFVVFLQNYLGYLELHTYVAIQPRYILSVVPVIIVMIVVAFNSILKNRMYLKLLILLVTLLLFTQGGGMITYVLQSKDSWYWHNSKVIEANQTVRKILQPFVIEK